jgi:hypothetical protein
MFLLFVKRCRVPVKVDNLFADFPHTRFKLTGRFTPPAFRADFPAQPVSVRVELLERGLIFSPLRIDTQEIINLCFLGSAASCQPAFYEIRLFANETDIEHGASVEAAVPGGKSTVAAVYDRRSLISAFIERRYNSRVTIIGVRR